MLLRLLLLAGCLTSQQHASVSQGRICSEKFACCHTETEVADQTFYHTQSQNTDTGPTSPSADPSTPGAWQGSHWCANFIVTGMTRPRKNPGASGIRTRDHPFSRRTPSPLGQRGGACVLLRAKLPCCSNGPPEGLVVRPLNLYLPSQCGSTCNCLSRSVPGIHMHVAGTLSK